MKSIKRGCLWIYGVDVNIDGEYEYQEEKVSDEESSSIRGDDTDHTDESEEFPTVATLATAAATAAIDIGDAISNAPVGYDDRTANSEMSAPTTVQGKATAAQNTV